jgi:hypothetical protein
MLEVGGKLDPYIAELVGTGIEEEVRARIQKDFLFLSVIMRTFFFSESIEIVRKSLGLVVVSQLIGLGFILHPDFFRLFGLIEQTILFHFQR